MTKWFGTPWPAPDRRAPVCADDANQVPVPVGSSCLYCTQMIQRGNQGVLLPYLREDGTAGQAAYHLRCFLRSVLGPTAVERLDL